MKDPLFSVLIANYNNARYIEEAIDSIYKQTYQNWEIVIVDDCSTDASYEIYNKIKDDDRIRIYFNKKNKGCGFTKRRCIEKAKGDICGYLDPDDTLALNALEVMTQLHTEKEKCSLIYSTHYVFNGVDNDITIVDYVGQIQDDEDYLIKSDKAISHFATFKRSLYNKTNGTLRNLQSAVDHDLYFLLEEIGELYFHNEPLYFYRINNPNSISIGNEQKVKNAFLSHVIASINACERRIINSSEFFNKNKTAYFTQLRNWLIYFYENKNKSHRFIALRFYFNYIRSHKFSLRSISHLLKLNKSYIVFLNRLRKFLMPFRI